MRPPATAGNGGRFVFRAKVFDADDLRRAHTRIAHEIVERNHGAARARPRRPLHAGRRDRPAAGRGHRALRGRDRAGRRARRRVLPRRHRAAAGAAARARPRSRSTSRAGWSCSSTTCSSPVARCGPRSTRSPSSVGRAPCSSRSSSTAVTVSCRSGPTSSARTCRPSSPRTCVCGSSRSTAAADGIELWGPAERGRRRMKHLLSIADLDRSEIESAAATCPSGSARSPSATSRRCRRSAARSWCRSSTRTRPARGISFETAAKRLSCDVMAFTVSSSSVKKGESLRDTVQTIEAMGIDAWSCATARGRAQPRRGLDRRQHRQRRRRLPRAPDPGAPRPPHAAPPPRTGPRRRSRRHRRRHRPLPGRAQQRPGDGRPRRERHARRAADAAARVARRLAGRCELTSSTTCSPRSTSSTCSGSSANARTRALFPSLREYTTRYGLTVERAARLRKDVLGHARRADEPRHRDRRGGRRGPGAR